MATNAEKFLEAYKRELKAAWRKAPHKFVFGEDMVPSVAEKMVEALKNKTASLSPTIKKVAKSLGVEKPNMTTIAAFLKEENRNG